MATENCMPGHAGDPLRCLTHGGLWLTMYEGGPPTPFGHCDVERVSLAEDLARGARGAAMRLREQIVERETCAAGLDADARRLREKLGLAAPLTELRITSVHEAGHAVLALVLQGRVQTISVRADAEVLGHVLASSKSHLDTPELMIGLGGIAAERVILGSVAPAGHDKEPGDLWYVRQFVLPDTEAMLLTITEALVRLHRRAVEQLAEVVAVRGEMNGHDVRRAVIGRLVPRA